MSKYIDDRTKMTKIQMTWFPEKEVEKNETKTLFKNSNGWDLSGSEESHTLSDWRYIMRNV